MGIAAAFGSSAYLSMDWEVWTRSILLIRRLLDHLT